MDPLSEIIQLLRPHAVFSKPITGRGEWGARYAAHGQPGFALVLEGRCWLGLKDAGPVLLERGDFVLLPDLQAFTLQSHPGVHCVPIPPPPAGHRPRGMRHGDPEGSPDFEMHGGSFRMDPVNAPLLLALLPGMIHIRAAEHGTERLSRVLGLLSEECATDLPGREMILTRLLEILLVECLRGPGHELGTVPTGLLAGLRDQALSKALRAFHADVREGWTVARLAEVASMSRSAFSARFTETLGCAPMEYLIRWRMALAKDALCRGGKSLECIAEEIGYESASAFSTAFRRRLGCSPGRFARSCRNGDDASASAMLG
jgi:AraC-like DNA-binding protein